MTQYFERELNLDYRDSLDKINDEFGENTADAIDTAIDILENPTAEKVRAFQLAVLFDLPLPRVGAADELIAHLQGRSINCISDCGCAGGQPFATCGFDPSCPRCEKKTPLEGWQLSIIRDAASAGIIGARLWLTELGKGGQLTEK